MTDEFQPDTQLFVGAVEDYPHTQTQIGLPALQALAYSDEPKGEVPQPHSWRHVVTMATRLVLLGILVALTITAMVSGR
jgi:hypothetical protein